MAEDVAEPETRPAELERNEKPDLSPERKNDEPSQQKDGKSADRKEQEAGRPALLPRWPLVVAGLVVAIFAAVVLYVIFRPHPDVRTADAYVMVHYATIAPRISDNEAALASAEAAVARDRSKLDEISATISRQPSIIEEQQAAVASARARLSFAQADARRYGNLATTGAGTVREHQQADSSLQEGQASLNGAEASLDAARRQLDVLKAQRSAAEAMVRADEARLEQARLNLSYTQIRAPIDGMVGERSVQVGNYVGPGATLMTVVPLDQVYIEANYLEVDLRHVRSGQPVTIHVDAYDIDLKGTVDSVPPASGAAFAPIAPNNATGNFTKIVQRLPVKIVVTPGQPLAKLLRVGLSVETTIHTGLEDVVGEQRSSSDRVTGH
jgi:membrane fusion protein, multidrug efflux system